MEKLSQSNFQRLIDQIISGKINNMEKLNCFMKYELKLSKKEASKLLDALIENMVLNTCPSCAWLFKPL